MLYWVRSLKGSWIARIFSVLLMLVFIAWGASSALPLMSGGSTIVAHIDGKPIDISAVQAEYQLELKQANLTVTPDATTRRQIAESALGTVLRQQALAIEEAALGISAPDQMVRAEVYAAPAFQTNGKFDQAKFVQVLQENGFSVDRYMALETAHAADTQLLPAVIGGATAPPALVDQLFAFITQARTAAMVMVPVAAMAPPAPPSAAVLQRYWKDHPAKFTAPPYRAVKIIVLSPAVLAAREPVSAAELQALYAQVSAQQTVPASRSVNVISVANEAKAAALAKSWQAGASWAQMQADAKLAGATAIALDHAQANQIPDPQLSAAVFSAPVGAVSGPVAGSMGYFVFKVGDAVAAGAPSLEALTPQLKAQVQLQKAQAQVAQDVDHVQDALAGQTPLDQLPGNLDLTAVQGTLDEQGNAEDGTPAPIPGGDKLRAAIIKAIFAAHPGDAPQLTAGPDGAYYAFSVDKVIAPAVKPFAQVQSEVAAAWSHDALEREAEIKATGIYQAVKGGQSLAQAGSAAGYGVTMSAPQTRNASANGMTSQMEQVLFSLKLGQPTMLQTETGFVVAVLAKIDQPKPVDDQADYAQVKQAMDKSVQNDVAESFFAGLQVRDKVQVNQALFSQIYR